MNDLVLVKILTLQPLDSRFAFLRHVGDDRCFIKVIGSINGTVEQDHLDACLFRILKHAVPACRTGSRKQEIIDLVLNELLRKVDLLIILQTVLELCVKAVRLCKGILEIVDVCRAVAGLVRVIVDDADLDQSFLAAAAAVSAGLSASCQCCTADHCCGCCQKDSSCFHKFSLLLISLTGSPSPLTCNYIINNMFVHLYR